LGSSEIFYRLVGTYFLLILLLCYVNCHWFGHNFVSLGMWKAVVGYFCFVKEFILQNAYVKLMDGTCGGILSPARVAVYILLSWNV